MPEKNEENLKKLKKAIFKDLKIGKGYLEIYYILFLEINPNIQIKMILKIIFIGNMKKTKRN